MSQNKRYICIHGHFYQPPRDNPWLDTVEPQPTAAPYRDWNARILDECYQANAAARILDGDGFITSIANNYAQISFNVGPTLMSWLQSEAPAVHDAIVRADLISREHFAGHGSAIAQAYNHMIMPLANERDLRTQTVWGVADFEHRFKRAPEGMWLPETAANTASLEALAAQGIKFTILAPRQARRVREISNDDAGEAGVNAHPWHDVSGGRIDPRRAYLVRLPSGRTIDVFFYDGPASRAVAFEDLLDDGNRFANRLLGLNHEAHKLAHIATDGETYGHHHRHGEMALAVTCRVLDDAADGALTNYAAYRAMFPAAWEAEIEENTSWSCAHGVERWKADCGCSSGGNPGWHQRWRAPLREALDWLRDQLAQVFDTFAAPLLRDPWLARDAYISVVLDRSADNVSAFLRKHSKHADLANDATVSEEDRMLALQLLEMQRNAMLMYTSCGWFFDDISGTEGVQVLRYAARAIELAACIDADFEDAFVERLERAPGNLPEFANGRVVWDKLVRTARVKLRDVVAHQAVMSLFEPANGANRADSHPRSISQSSSSGPKTQKQHRTTYCFDTETYDFERRQAGLAKLVTGRMRIVSRITGAEGIFCFGALHLGDHNIMGGVVVDPGIPAFGVIRDEVVAPFERADLVAVQRALDEHFHDRSFSLGSLLADEREHILSLILQRPVEDAGRTYAQIYQRHAPLMGYLAGLGMPIPEVFQATAQMVLNQQLRHALEDDPPDLDLLRAGCDNALRSKIELDRVRLSYSWQQALERSAERAAIKPLDFDELDDLASLASLASELQFDVNTWKVQNMCWELSRTTLSTRRRLAAAGNDDAGRWLQAFTRLCGAVRLRIPQP